MKLDWKAVAAAAVGVVLAFVVVKTLVGYLPASVQGYIPETLKK